MPIISSYGEITITNRDLLTQLEEIKIDLTELKNEIKQLKELIEIK